MKSYVLIIFFILPSAKILKFSKPSKKKGIFLNKKNTTKKINHSIFKLYDMAAGKPTSLDMGVISKH